MLSPMRYKNYIWPHNPRVYSIDYGKTLVAHKIPYGLYRLQNLGRTNRIMAGQGEFVGEDAYSQFGMLANVFYEDTPGLLVHPLWQVSNAYFVSLRLEQEPRPDYVRYSFVFWEDYSQTGDLVLRVTGSTGGTEGGAQSTAASSAPQYHRVVKGDTLWALAKTYGLTLSELIALNPQIKNPNLIYVGDEVRVK